MALELLQLSKTYQGQVVIPEWTQQFEPCETVAIYGGNGSGKSTLLKLLSGQISPTRGHLRCEDIPSETWSLHTSYTGPHVDLIDGYTPKELFAQHAQLRAFRPEAGLEHLPIPPYAFDRPLAQLSSGMKQRIKLALAIWTDAPLLLLDEPCSRLDQVGIEWYSSLLGASLSPTLRYSHRIVFVASNHKKEETMHCRRAFLPTGEAVVPL